ncbi:hypothetical protein [Glycomyces rhizosphaerae]|uniref:Tetratricopeptide repeat protein n=1 Tax=Glycomyces rhizosphaerae TaxID=2054422 RepID=A0ABV7PY73_9ACTN
MNRSPQELRAQLDAAAALPDSLAKVSRLQDLARWVEAADDVDLRIDANLALVEALKDSPEVRNKKVNQRYIAQVARTVGLHKAHPYRFSEDQYRRLWVGFFWAALRFLEDDPTLIPGAQARELLADMADHCPPNKEFELHRMRMKLAMRAADFAEAERCERQMRSTAPYDLDRSHEAVSLGLMWATVDRHEDAVRALSVYTLGEGIDDFSRDWADPREALGQLAMSYLHLGRRDEARRAHLEGTDRERIRHGFLPVHFMFCAATGNLDRGLGLLHRHVHELCMEYIGVEMTWLYASVAALLRRVIEQGRGHERWELPKDDSAHAGLAECGGGREWTYEQFFHSMLTQAQDFADRVDDAHGTTFHGRNAHRIAYTEPVAPIWLPPGDWGRPVAIPVIEGDPGHVLDEAMRNEDETRRAQALWDTWRAAELQGLDEVAFDTQAALVETLLGLTWSASVATQLVATSERVAAGARSFVPERRSGYVALLLRAAVRLIDELAAFVPLHRIRALLEAIGRLPEASALTLFELRIRLEANANQSEKVTDLWDRASRSAAAQEAVPIAAGRAFAELERDEEAIALLEPRIGTGGVRADDLLLPYLRTGREAFAREAHESHWESSDMNDARLAGHLLFCLRHGGLDRAREFLHRNLYDYELPPGNPAAIRNHAASVLLARRLVDAGLGDEQWTWPESDHSTGGPQEWTYAEYHKEVGVDMWRRLHRMERCYGSEHLRPRILAITTAD